MNKPNPVAPYETFELLRLLARTQLHPDQVDRVKQQVQHHKVSWEAVIRSAFFHGVQPLVQKNVLAVCPEDLPAGMISELNDMSRTAAFYNLFLTKELGRLIHLLNNRDVRVLALKGPVLAKVAYGNLNLRTYGDLDILIPRKDFSKVEGILAEEHYEPREKVSGLSGLRQALYLWQTGQYSFKRGADVFHIDLHTAIMPPLYTYATNFDQLWNRAEKVRLLDLELPVCQPEDMLHILCYHGVKNRWEALKHVCDVAELLRARSDLDWDSAVHRAYRTRGERILYLGLYMAHSILDAPIPADIKQKIAKQPMIEQIAAPLVERMSQSMNPGIMEFGKRFHFHMSIQDTIISRVRYGGFALLRRVLDWLDPGIELQ